MRVPTRQAFRLLPLALLLGVSLYSLGFWLIEPLSTPTADDYQKIGERIRSQWKPGDAVTVRPWWAARIREHVGDLPFVQVRDVASEDWSTFARLWVVSLPGHHHQPGGPFADGSYPIEETLEAGALTLRRFGLPERTPVLYDFRERLSSARVRINEPGGPKACSRWVEDRWVCSRHDWNFVGKMIVELGDDPREVIWAHPADHPIEITFPEVPGGRILKVYTGFTPPAARTPGGAPVTLRVLVNGKELGKVDQPNQTGFFPTDLDISSFGPGPLEITFAVTAPHGGMRHFCFTGQVRG